MSSLSARLGVLRGQTGAPGGSERVHPASIAWEPDKIVRRLGGEWIHDGVLRIRSMIDEPTSRENPLIMADGSQAECFLDTETTGLSGGVGTSVFLIGMAYPRDGCWILDQLLLARPGAERDFWEAADRTLRNRCWVSYNGKSFDAPLIAARSRLHYGASLAPADHIDLVHWVRRAFAGKWPDCRLGRVEAQLLKQPRQDDLPGSMAPMAYQTFLRSGCTALLRRIVEHHRQDVVSLIALRRALEAVYRDPKSFDADCERIGSWWLERGDLNRAESCLQASGTEAAQLRLASLHRQRGALTQAVAIWRTLAHRGHAEALLRLAIHAEHHDKDPRSAHEWCTALIAIQPDCPHHRHRLARLQEKSRQYEFGAESGSSRSVPAIRTGSRSRNGFCRDHVSRAARKART